MTDLVRSGTADATEYDRSHPLYQLFSGWLLDAAHSVNTEAAYRRGFLHWATFLADRGVPDTGLLTVTRDHVNGYRRTLETEGAPASTVAHRLAVVSSFYTYCEQVGAIDRNPAEKAKRPKVDPDYSPTSGLTLDEAQRMVATAERLAGEHHQRLEAAAAAGRRTVRLTTMWKAADRDYAIVTLMLCTGGRLEEISAAQVEDLGYDRGVRTLTVTRKGGKLQKLALGDGARVIDAYIAREQRTTGPLFPTSNGTRPDPAWLFRAVQRIATAADIPGAAKLSPHSLRHTFATLAFDGGASIDDVQDAMGHKDPRTTRRYDRARNRLDRSPVHKVSRALLGPPTNP